MIRFFVQNGNKDFLRLWVAQLISQFGDRIHQLALIGLIAERSGGSALGLAKLMTCTILPVFIVQPFAGVLVDRLDRRTTLFVCDIFRGLLVLTIPFLFFFSRIDDSNICGCFFSILFQPILCSRENGYHSRLSEFGASVKS